MVATMVAMDVKGRIGRLRDRLAATDGPPALVVTAMSNIRYLTGFTGSTAMLFVLPGEAILMTDGRYEVQAGEQLAGAGVDARVEVAAAAHQAERATAIVATAGLPQLGLEAAHISWARQRAFADSWFPEVELVPTVGMVEALRRIKDEGELARLAEAARIADAALEALRPRLGSGLTEEAFGRALDFEMRELGASGPSFETIVAGGPNAAKPHHRPGPRLIAPGEAVVLDFGARFDGYCSDMTRTVWVDDISSPEVRRAVAVVLESQAAGVAAVRAGVSAREVDHVCRQVIADAGLAERFVHGTGHGVGLDIHEAPSVAASSTDMLEAGHVVTVEPGVYLPGVGGVRIEDTVVVTESGCFPITSTPKDLSPCPPSPPTT
jgi:Xaa-Pro aminopeptidase